MMRIMISIMRAKRAKIFTAGPTQGARLSEELRSPGSAVLVHRRGNAVVLGPESWPDDYVESFAGIADDFVRPPQGRLTAKKSRDEVPAFRT
jgi:virulence-associated protein VagC